MAKSTFLTLCNRVRQECSVAGTMASVTDQTGIFQRIVTWVADSDYLIQSAFSDWDFLWSAYSTTTTPTVAQYSPPTDIGTWVKDSFFLDFSAAGNRRLSYVDYDTYRAVYRNGIQTQSKPTVFTIQPDRSIVVYPVPEEAYSLSADYYRIPTRLSGNTDTSAVPERFEQAIIALARTKYAEEEGAGVMLGNAMQEYGFWMEEMKKSHLPYQSDRSRGVSDQPIVVRPE